jgi:hypothetical protein
LRSFVIGQPHNILLGPGALLFLGHYTGGKPGHQYCRGQPLVQRRKNILLPAPGSSESAGAQAVGGQRTVVRQ